ncbi:hypothetical protein [Paraburkholderia caffeinilytica]|uniref:hypothetical protein n=1 Tax=Paraburkholderia caffeinilytica TaxID=1761016 RepID=UPI0038B8A000
MTAPVTKEHTKKAFHFPKSSRKQAVDGAEPAVAPEQPAEAAPVVEKASKAKRAAPADATPVVKKAAKKAKSATATEAKPATKKPAKAKRSAAEAAPVVKKAAKTKPSATAEAEQAVKKAAKPKRSATAEAAAPVSAPEAKKTKQPKKEKVVRDSFTMPKSDYDKIASLKQKCLDAGVPVKKSELLRAGLAMLESAAPQRLLAAVSSLETVKTGRPAKG